jgi:sulfide:quinone oxidoreductase
MTGPRRPLQVVVAGGGVGALEAMLALRELAGPRIHTTVVSPRDELEIPALRTIATFRHTTAPRPSLRALVRRGEATLRPTVVRRVLGDEHAVELGDEHRLRYDALIVAVGARPVPALGPGTITYGLEDEAEDLNATLADAVAGRVTSIAFVVPAGVSWTLPLYELALMSAHRLHARGARDVRLSLVTPESAPLALFGPAAATAVAERLARAGIDLHTDAYASPAGPGQLALAPGERSLAADRIIALPALRGPALRGVPCDEEGFIPIDADGRVSGMDDVWAVGDATAFPVKQGGLACQLADAVAEQLAARAGADVAPRGFRPTLRGRLLTGEGVQSMASGLGGGHGEGEIAEQALWEPARKVDGRYLSPALGPARGFEPRWAAIDIDIALPAPSAGAPLALDPYSPPRTGR